MSSTPTPTVSVNRYGNRMPATVLLHDDRTECHHDGPPRGVLGDDSGPICPDGRPIRWVQFGEKTLTIDEAYTAIASLSRSMFQAINPMITALSQACARIATDPAVQALAAYAAVTQRAREAEEQRTRDQRPTSSQPARTMTGDPCGGGPV